MLPALSSSRLKLDVGDLFHETLKIWGETEQARLNFIRTDLEVCLALADVAETKYNMGHREQAARTIASAEKGYSDILRFFYQARGMTPEIEKELQSKFRQVRERLDELLQRLG